MNLFTIALLACSALSAMPAAAADYVDQNAPTNNAVMAGFNQPNLAQSFKQSASNVSGAGIYLGQGFGSGSGTITIGLWNMLPNQAGATQLASGSALAAGPDQWLDVFWNAAAVTAGSTYYLVFNSTNSSLGIAGDTGNGYANGQVYANAGFGSFSNYDYTFRTYASDAVAAVPEPATWGMMILGFGLMGGALRSRKTKVAFA